MSRNFLIIFGIILLSAFIMCSCASDAPLNDEVVLEETDDTTTEEVVEEDTTTLNEVEVEPDNDIIITDGKFTDETEFAENSVASIDLTYPVVASDSYGEHVDILNSIIETNLDEIKNKYFMQAAGVSSNGENVSKAAFTSSYEISSCTPDLIALTLTFKYSYDQNVYESVKNIDFNLASGSMYQ